MLLLLGFWVLAALPGSTAPGSSSGLLLGLAAVVAALLVALVAAGVLLPGFPVWTGGVASAMRSRTRRLPRLLDPDAAGRPRPRAPSAYPAVPARAC
jgi:hypothetical protein